MKKSIINRICVVICMILVLAVLYLLTAFFGNPISPVLAKHNAQKYLSQNHGDEEFQIERVYYDLKSGGYNVDLHSPTSPDSYFTIYFDALGRYKYDTYESITNGSNTYFRLYSAYSALIDRAFEDVLPFDVSIAFGELAVEGQYEVFTYIDENGQAQTYTLGDGYGLDIASLKLDKEYDIREFGRNYGILTIYIHDSIVTTERTAELLLEVTKYLDQHNIPFHTIHFHHCAPRNDDGQNVGDQITLYYFPKAYIYQQNLTEKVEEYWSTAQEHHAIQDGYKKSDQ